MTVTRRLEGGPLDGNIVVMQRRDTIVIAGDGHYYLTNETTLLWTDRRPSVVFAIEGLLCSVDQYTNHCYEDGYNDAIKYVKDRIFGGA